MTLWSLVEGCRAILVELAASILRMKANTEAESTTITIRLKFDVIYATQSTMHDHGRLLLRREYQHTPRRGIHTSLHLNYTDQSVN